MQEYKASEDFRYSLIAQKYYNAENDAVARKKLLKPQQITTTKVEKTIRGDEVERTNKKTLMVEVDGNRVYSRFFYRIVTQENQHLLSNGVTIGDVGGVKGDDIKKMLGPGFDTVMARMGENALVQGVCWAFWNVDHVEPLEAARDERSGFVTLVDEETSTPRVGVQFWQIDSG